MLAVRSINVAYVLPKATICVETDAHPGAGCRHGDRVPAMRLAPKDSGAALLGPQLLGSRGRVCRAGVATVHNRVCP
jgi:hypothetical protein